MSVKYATNFKQKNGKQLVAKILLPDNFFASTIYVEKGYFKDHG